MNLHLHIYPTDSTVESDDSLNQELALASARRLTAYLHNKN